MNSKFVTTCYTSPTGFIRFLSDGTRRENGSSTTHTKDSNQDDISVSLFKNPIVHQLWTARQNAKQKQQHLPGEGGSGPKSPSDSRVEVSYPFSTDKLLWEAYRNPWGQMRLGKLLEDLDALAGNIAFFHVQTSLADDDAEYPVIVTASVDRIRLHRRPKSGVDQLLSGQVTWTGTSSMEIRMQCVDAGSEDPWLEAYVTFVTLDPVTSAPMKIPAVVPQTDLEKQRFEAGAQRAAVKKQRRKRQQEIVIDRNIETKAAALMKQAGPLLTMPSLADPHSILIKDTAMQNAMIAQPQVQNLHRRIFGGFLMRRAFELAYATTYVFGGSRPIFLEVDEISFASPVDVGDLLVFQSRILYTQNDAGHLQDFFEGGWTPSTTSKDPSPPVALVHVEVEAWVTEPEQVSAKMSNQFYFTFAVPQEKWSSRVRKVLPSNLDEARRVAMRMRVDVERQKLH